MVVASCDGDFVITSVALGKLVDFILQAAYIVATAFARTRTVNGSSGRRRR